MLNSNLRLSVKPLYIKPPPGICMKELLQKEALTHHFNTLDVCRFESVYLNGQRFLFDGENELAPLSTEDLVKIFPRPKRFEMQALSKNLVLYENQDFLVVDKPSRVPSLPVASNSKENCKFFFESLVGSYLFPVHRLDELTCGVLMFAKNSNSVKIIQEKMRARSIKKIYRAKVTNSLPSQVFENHIAKGTGKMLIFNDPVMNSKTCKLEVLKCRSLNHNSHQVDIRLYTGRTHQIRAQLRHLGSPLVADPIYGSESSNGDSFFLCSKTISWDNFEFISRYKNDHPCRV